MEYSHDLNYKRNTMNDLVNPTGKWIYLSTETDVSGYKIFEIINHCCGTHLKGWMKAWYQINDEWAMWFPKITTTGKTKSHSSYGGDFWINNGSITFLMGFDPRSHKNLYRTPSLPEPRRNAW